MGRTCHLKGGVGQPGIRVVLSVPGSGNSICEGSVQEPGTLEELKGDSCGWILEAERVFH